MQDELRRTGLAAGSAMQQAVAAEHQARQAIESAQAAAQARVADARARARAILDAAPERIARLRERRARTVQLALARIEGDEARALQELHAAAIPAETLTATVDAVARRLTGADREPGAS